jgi:hypothetical protein
MPRGLRMNRISRGTDPVASVAARKLVDPALSSPLIVVAAIAMFHVGSTSAAGEPERPAADQRREKRAQLLQQMKEIAEATEVRYQTGDRQPQLVASPVFRYDDQPRQFIDATMWVWTDGGRPVAFEKIEAMTRGRPEWGFCFTSVAEDLLAVKWGDGREFRSTAVGVEFRPLVDAPAVPARNATRKLEARKVVREFSARILTDDTANTSEEMRLLPTPILEYTDPQTKEYLGAVFGLTTSGTNPDVLILLEPRRADGGEPIWHYAIGRMTIGGVTLNYRGNVVWQVDFYPPRPTAFPTWTFFYTSRNEPQTPEEAR